MKYDTCHPGKLIPYHTCHADRLSAHPSALPLTRGKAGPSRKAFPLIPVIDIPPGLQLANGTPLSELGDYILYNGHHRRMAALCCGVTEVAIAILETDEDLLLHEGSEKLITAPHLTSIADHKKWVYDAVVAKTEAALAGEAWIHEQLRLLQ